MPFPDDKHILVVKNTFALTVNSPLANSFSPAHGVGVHDSSETTCDRARPMWDQICWRKSKNNRSDPAATAFTWSCSQDLLSGSNDIRLSYLLLPQVPGDFAVVLTLTLQQLADRR